MFFRTLDYKEALLLGPCLPDAHLAVAQLALLRLSLVLQHSKRQIGAPTAQRYQESTNLGPEQRLKLKLEIGAVALKMSF